MLQSSEGNEQREPPYTFMCAQEVDSTLENPARVKLKKFSEICLCYVFIVL